MTATRQRRWRVAARKAMIRITRIGLPRGKRKEEGGGVSKRGEVAIRGSHQVGWGGTEDDAASDEVGRGGRGREMTVSPFTRHRDAWHRREG